MEPPGCWRLENGTHLVERPYQVLGALLMRYIPVGQVGGD